MLSSGAEISETILTLDNVMNHFAEDVVHLSNLLCTSPACEQLRMNSKRIKNVVRVRRVIAFDIYSYPASCCSLPRFTSLSPAALIIVDIFTILFRIESGASSSLSPSSLPAHRFLNALYSPSCDSTVRVRAGQRLFLLRTIRCSCRLCFGHLLLCSHLRNVFRGRHIRYSYKLCFEYLLLYSHMMNRVCVSDTITIMVGIVSALTTLMRLAARLAIIDAIFATN